MPRRGLGPAAAILLLVSQSPQAQAWRAEQIAAPGRVEAIETIDGNVQVAIASTWYRMILRERQFALEPTAPFRRPLLPPNALPDGRISTGTRNIARAWLAEPTRRYTHAALGDAVEAASLIVERRSGRQEAVRLAGDAVFEDLEPRLADLDRNGRDRILVVKSYLDRGSCLAVIGERDGRMQVVTETPPVGVPHRWLNPAGIADFNGDGRMDIALVLMPHALGRLELWSWLGDKLSKSAEIGGFSNHAIGSRVLRMSAVADFDRDGNPDLALPSFDRRAVRVVSFAPTPREIAKVTLPARAVMEFGLLRDSAGHPVVILGLEDGKLMAVRR